MIEHLPGFFRLPLATAALAVLALAGCSVFTPRPVTPISNVVSMSDSELSTDQVLSRVRAARTTCALTGSDVGRLGAGGVAGRVQVLGPHTQRHTVDRLTRFWVLGESLGGCASCYPQPVNLAMLDAGGNGMANAGGIGRVSTFARPAGVPDWVPASPAGPSAPMLGADDVLAMAKSGASADTMVARIRGARIKNVIESGGLRNVGTQYTAGLKGSELAALAKQGVPDAALDALQAQFLAEYIEFARLRYQSWGKGSVPN